VKKFVFPCKRNRERVFFSLRFFFSANKTMDNIDIGDYDVRSFAFWFRGLSGSLFLH